MILLDGFDSVSPNFTVRDVTTELSGPQLTSCRTEMYLQLIDHWMLSISSRKITSKPCC
ncbi:unnamed protein product [Schistosoma margrebowiei]|uniref:Uncharacterized protein n=1 Tax=Schistosoma margrebowiei TaxID=48269 RepID=A0A183LBS2_9TREM|nr:unnamed protein product [Schistosoma margrebowiei]